jgi:hypothetical protein
VSIAHAAGLAPVVVEFHCPFDREFDAVQHGDGTGSPRHATLGAGTVVAGNEDDYCVVEFSALFNSIDHPTDLIVDEFVVTGVDLHLTFEEFARLCIETVPCWHVLGARCEFGSLGNNAEIFLTFERDFSLLIPAVSEFAFVLVGPLFRRVMRRMCRPRCVVQKEWPVWRNRILIAHPGDGLVRLIDAQVVALLRSPPGLHRILVLVDRRIPLVHLAADETVEIVKPQRVRPAAMRTDHARLRAGDVVVLADPGSRVSVVLQDAAHRSRVLRNDAGVAGKAGTRLHNDAGASGMVVVTSQQRGPGRRADGRRVEPVVAQAVLGQFRQHGSLTRTAKSTRRAEAGIVDENEQNVRRIFRCRTGHEEIRVGLGVVVCLADLALERGVRVRHVVPDCGNCRRCRALAAGCRDCCRNGNGLCTSL